MRLKPRLINYFQDYALYHQTAGNKICHYIGVPTIAITLLGLLARLEIGQTSDALIRLDGGTVLLLVGALFFVWVDWRVGLPLTLLMFGGYAMAREMPLWLLWTVQIFGWVAQGVGHAVYEKKNPAFFKNLEHLLIGPMWVFCKAFGIVR